MLNTVLILGYLLLSACVTPPRSYNSERPGDAWDSSCTSKVIENFPNWIIVNCAFTNRSEQELIFPPKLDLTVQDEIWRKPEPEELEQLKKDLRLLQKARTSAPIFTGGGDRVEMFFSQVLITSGLWIAQSFKSDPGEVLSPASSAKVPAGKTLERVFALYKEKQGHPEVLDFRDPDGLFEKVVPIEKDSGAARQRRSSELNKAD